MTDTEYERKYKTICSIKATMLVGYSDIIRSAMTQNAEIYSSSRLWLNQQVISDEKF